MAGADRMTVEEVVRKVLLDEHADVIREAVKAVAAEMMELEVSELIGAEHGERRPQDRATRRNGYRARRWDTRAGEIELQIPKIRQGSYFPSFLEPRRRSEQALLAVVQQAYVCGVSTRRVDQLVESLGLRVSKSEVSRVCGALDEHVEAFRTRPLEGAYPYVFLDGARGLLISTAGSDRHSVRLQRDRPSCRCRARTFGELGDRTPPHACAVLGSAASEVSRISAARSISSSEIVSGGAMRKQLAAPPVPPRTRLTDSPRRSHSSVSASPIASAGRRLSRSSTSSRP
jgi:hypothetical protein